MYNVANEMERAVTDPRRCAPVHGVSLRIEPGQLLLDPSRRKRALIFLRLLLRCAFRANFGDEFVGHRQ